MRAYVWEGERETVFKVDMCYICLDNDGIKRNFNICINATFALNLLTPDQLIRCTLCCLCVSVYFCVLKFCGRLCTTPFWASRTDDIYRRCQMETFTRIHVHTRTLAHSHTYTNAESETHKHVEHTILCQRLCWQWQKVTLTINKILICTIKKFIGIVSKLLFFIHRFSPYSPFFSMSTYENYWICRIKYAMWWNCFHF